MIISVVSLYTFVTYINHNYNAKILNDKLALAKLGLTAVLQSNEELEKARAEARRQGLI